ncbi:MAG: hypothetical protein Q4D02_03625 [Clostridia bacterium]|nr:hypothetical protein [Clostridia bacterium]
MLNKQEIKELLKNKKYDKIVHIFRTEYTNMVFEFAKKNNIELNENTEVEELILIISQDFPELEGYMMTLSNLLTSPDMNLGDHLNHMINNYDTIKEALT